MSAAEVARYGSSLYDFNIIKHNLCFLTIGKSMSSAAIHLGLRDVLEWMEDMESSGLITY